MKLSEYFELPVEERTVMAATIRAELKIINWNIYQRELEAKRRGKK